jgi:hypothetical protein
VEVLCKGSREWVEYSRNSGEIIATVGTSQELMIDSSPGLWDYQWSIGLVGGDDHPLWGHNSGKTDTIGNAKRKAENFLDIILVFENANLSGSAEEIINRAQQIIDDAKISEALFKKDMVAYREMGKS